MTQAADGTIPEASLPSAPLLLFSQPVGLEQMLQHAMSLTEYTTFSTVMRTKAEEVAKRRAWAERAEARRSRSEAIHASLESPECTTEGLTAAWGHLRSRTLSLAMPGEDLEDGEESLSSVMTAEGMPPEVIEMMRIEDERYAAMCALDSPPQDDEAKSELLQLLAAPFLRLLGFLPNSASSKTCVLSLLGFVQAIGSIVYRSLSRQPLFPYEQYLLACTRYRRYCIDCIGLCKLTKSWLVVRYCRNKREAAEAARADHVRRTAVPRDLCTGVAAVSPSPRRRRGQHGSGYSQCQRCCSRRTRGVPSVSGGSRTS